MKEEAKLTTKEKNYIKEVDFLITRHQINKKVNSLLLSTEATLKQYISGSNLCFPAKTSYKAGKITKGEHYLQLPYYILDYPALLSKESIFAIRTMFWWGNYFIITFHLSGYALKRFRPFLIKNLPEIYPKQTYLYINDSDPWQHHIDVHNYRMVETLNPNELIQILGTTKHFKLCQTLSLDEWDYLPGFALKFFKLILGLIQLEGSAE